MKRLPNGAGSVTKLSGQRRKPYMARTAIDQRCLGTFETYQEALAALMDFSRNPWDVDNSHVTLERLWDSFLRVKGDQLGKSTLAQLKTAHKKTESLHGREYSSIKAYEMQRIVDGCTKSKSSKSVIKNYFRHLDLFAREMDITSKMYSDLVVVKGGTPKKERKIFTGEEVEKLWKGVEKPFYDSALFMLYTGFRISEMLDIRVENVDLELGSMRGGTKTEAGKNRLVPIHHKIYPLVEERVSASKKGFLFEREGKHITPGSYRDCVWAPIMNEIGAEHTPHECRHTFRSWLDSAGAKRTCIDKIMGHASGNVGEDVYTHKTFEELKATIEMVTN